MPEHDSYHDYRPDPTFEIVSHLASATPDPEDAFVPPSAKKARGLLQGFHERFVYGQAKADNKKLREPTKGKGPERKWDEMAIEDQVAEINKLTWKELCAEMKEVLTVADFGLPLLPNGKPQYGAVNGTQPQWELRPYFVAMLRAADSDWKGQVLVRLFKKPDDAEVTNLTRDEANKVMVGMLNFRMSYVHDLICTLKEGGVEKVAEKGLKILAKAVGSADKTSDIDITLSGPDDVAGMTELNRYARQVWQRELGTLFDTMIYVRDWMLCTDNINRENTTKKGPADADPSIQVEVLDFLGDIYGLVKVRRFTSAKEWAALKEAVYRDVKIDGLEVTDVPRLGRFELAEQIFQTQYVKPFLRRLAPIKAEWAKDPHHETPADDQELLDAIEHFDPDGFLRTSNLAYSELAAKVRDDEAALKADPQYRGTYNWRQNDGPSLVNKEVPFNLAGMVAFLERQSLLVSEMAIFAMEAYNTQGSLWQVVGGQGGDRPENLTLEHYLQAYNEQVGDALKELRHHGHLSRHAAEEGDGTTEKNEVITAYFRASKYEQRMCEVVASLHAGLQIVRHANAVKSGRKDDQGNDLYAVINPIAAKNHKNDHSITPASGEKKAECATCKEWVKTNFDTLKDEHPIEHRKKVYVQLFPGKISPDEEDLALLGFEVAVAQFYDEHIGKLLKVRKLGGEYSPANMDDAGRLRESEKFVTEAMKEGTPFNRLVRDPARDPGRVDLGVSTSENGKMKWGLEQMMVHLLTHCAIVNRTVRSVFSRGPLDLYVRSFAE